MRFIHLLLLFSAYIRQGRCLECYFCTQDTTRSIGDCMEGYCNLKPITCEANQTACYVYDFLEGYWDTKHYRRGCTDNPDNLCKNLKKNKYKSTACLVCKEDKCRCLECYFCTQDSINTVGDCMEGYCNLKPITCEANQTACYIYDFLDGYWDSTHYSRGCTDNPDNLCQHLKKTKFRTSICHICKEDKCNYMHIAETWGAKWF